MFGKLIAGVFQSLPRITASSHHCPTASVTSSIWSPWGLTFIRNKMRYHFPHAGERKRVKTHGWVTRMSTPSGRKIIMRRILRGKYVLSH